MSDRNSSTIPPASPDARTSGVSSASAGRTGERDRFEAFELAVVLSHFDLGVIETIGEFPRGSRRAPKVKLGTEKGKHLLKRRARGKDDPYKVAFCHDLQLHLAGRQFPLPRLVGTRHENNSMLQWEGRIYEMFEYISGDPYDSTLESTHDAGRVLGLFHKLLQDYQPQYETARGSYHAAKEVRSSLQQVPETLKRVDPEGAAEQGSRIEELTGFLLRAYNEASMHVSEVGLDDWPLQIIHSDWHPGNMLFRKNRLVAVIDYDAARLQPRVIDTANGALQFSIIGGNEDPAGWPDQLDGSRFKRFLRGYDSVNVLSKAELRVMPWLMIEALIAETVIPVAATGSFARLEGFGFLAMIERKVGWLRENAERLSRMLD